jgi:hypothetical protein
MIVTDEMAHLAYVQGLQIARAGAGIAVGRIDNLTDTLPPVDWATWRLNGYQTALHFRGDCRLQALVQAAVLLNANAHNPVQLEVDVLHGCCRRAHNGSHVFEEHFALLVKVPGAVVDVFLDPSRDVAVPFGNVLPRRYTDALTGYDFCWGGGGIWSIPHGFVFPETVAACAGLIGDPAQSGVLRNVLQGCVTPAPLVPNGQIKNVFKAFCNSLHANISLEQLQVMGKRASCLPSDLTIVTCPFPTQPVNLIPLHGLNFVTVSAHVGVLSTDFSNQYVFNNVIHIESLRKLNEVKKII